MNEIILSDFFIRFILIPGPAQSIQTRPGTSLCSCSGLSLPSRPHLLFLLTIPEQDHESVTAPCTYCIRIRTRGGIYGQI